MSRVGRKRRSGNKGLLNYLYQRTNGYFFAIHPITLDTVSYPTKDPDKAKRLHLPALRRWEEEVLDKKASAIATRVRVIENPAGGQLFTEFSREFREIVLPTLKRRTTGKLLAPRTRRYYDYTLRKQIEPDETLSIPLISVTPTTGRTYLAQWLESPKHYNNVLSLLHILARHAIVTGKLTDNPFKDIERLPVAKRETYITNEHYTQITSTMKEWHARVFDLFYLLSQNPQDVLGLKDQEITDRVIIKRGKTNATIEIEPNSDLKEAVQWFRDWKAKQHLVSPYLVCYPRSSRRRSVGKKVSVDYMSRIWTAGVEAAGLPKGIYQQRDIRPKGLTDEYLIAGDSDKGGHKTQSMKEHYRRIKLPMRAKNNLKVLR